MKKIRCIKSSYLGKFWLKENDDFKRFLYTTRSECEYLMGTSSATFTVFISVESYDEKNIHSVLGFLEYVQDGDFYKHKIRYSYDENKRGDEDAINFEIIETNIIYENKK